MCMSRAICVHASFHICQLSILCVRMYVSVCVFVCTATHCNTLQHTATHCNTLFRLTRVHVSCHMYSSVVWHIRMSHVSHMPESFHRRAYAKYIHICIYIYIYEKCIYTHIYINIYVHKYILYIYIYIYIRRRVYTISHTCTSYVRKCMSHVRKCMSHVTGVPRDLMRAKTRE